ncbi:MAG: transglycosylase SLT domain-containing protein [Alistipes sp.]|nr:transglycosylase SLT domain-containing protein [Alistipes sp.]
MWRKILNMLVVPLLFVVVSGLSALFVVDVVRYSQRIAPPHEEKTEWVISQFDSIFQEVGAIYGVDWLLLSAIASAESKYTPTAVSKAGATGLMQIMPAVAISMGYAPESLIDSRVSAEIAAKLLHENNDMLRFPAGFDSAERVKFILACYNAGYSRIADARRLARYFEADADSWSVVSTFLPLLAEQEYANHEVVHSGVFAGSEETIAYVAKVMRIYGRYKRKVAE